MKIILHSSLKVLTAAALGLSAACAQQSASTATAPQPSPAVSVAASPLTVTSPPSAAAQDPEAAMPRVSAEELKRLVADQQAVILDVRSPEIYREGHIKGAINLPILKLEAGEYKDLPRDKRIISYCT